MSENNLPAGHRPLSTQELGEQSSKITIGDIRALYSEIRAELFELIPSAYWKIAPVGVVLHEHHGKYGMATPSGEVQIYKGYLGTSAHKRLANTIRHELAHLCVGLREHHNRKFKRIASLFGCVESGFDEEDEQIMAGIPYKWTVLAHLENGAVVDLGGAHRKTKKWAEYHKRENERHTHKGVLVLRYEFIESSKECGERTVETPLNTMPNPF